MPTIEAGSRTIGDGQPCFVAVEVGLNHNGDPRLAHAMIDAAADAGADAVKFQNYRARDFLADASITYEYVSAGETVVEPQIEMFERYELPDEVWPEFRDHCRERDVVFFATPTSFSALEELVRLGVPLLKNGSDYLVHIPLIEAMARTGIPTVLSTGMATYDEIDAAAQSFRAVGGTDLILLHCTSTYPAPATDVHLRKIGTLRESFGCLVGFSDHTDGIVAALGAVALGACFVEKHFTLDRSLPGPDHHFSTDPAQLAELVDAIRQMEASLGTAAIGPTTSELVGRRDYRLSCVAARELFPGETLMSEDVVFQRPGSGIPPGELPLLIGRTLHRLVPSGTVLAESDLEPR